MELQKLNAFPSNLKLSIELIITESTDCCERLKDLQKVPQTST
jgi:hypothetical protein